jgi:hypothetical protein
MPMVSPCAFTYERLRGLPLGLHEKRPKLPPKMVRSMVGALR